MVCEGRKAGIMLDCRRPQPDVRNRETIFVQSSLPSSAMHPDLRSRPNAAIINGEMSEEEKSNL